MATKSPFSKQVIYASDLREETTRARKYYGLSDRHSTGIRELDEYLRGGYGRHDNWEMVVLHGGFKTGKTTVALNMLRGALEAGTKVGIFGLEDDPGDMNYRLALAMDDPGLEGKWYRENLVRYLPRRTRRQPRYKLSELLNEMEDWYTSKLYGVEIILLDHLQFAYESAEAEARTDKWTAQTQFVQDLNALLTEVKKTAILVSQENRAGDIAGSIGIPRAATKLIGIERLESEPSIITLRMEPSRGLAPRHYVVRMEQRNERLYIDSTQCADFNKDIRQ